MMAQLIHGINPVIEALKAPGIRLREIIIAQGRKANVGEIIRLADKRHIPVRWEEKHDLAALSRVRSHQGVVAVVEDYGYVPLEGIVDRWQRSGSPATVLVLDSIQDPQNLGAIVRTANAVGAHGVIIPKHRSAGVTPAAVKASAGATAHVPIARVTNIASTLQELKREGIWVLGAASEASQSLYSQELTGDLAVVIGSEGYGIRPRVLNMCDSIASIPMRGQIPSLNASVAAGIILYEIVRQRLKVQGDEDRRGVPK
jgi:23S rRNA (guanosine2251-2'-O)-methyltransferase